MSPIKRILVLVAFACSSSICNGASTKESVDTEWPAYGHDSAGTRYSPLTQITTDNVGLLKEAWVYHFNSPLGQTEGGDPNRRPPDHRRNFALSEMTPLVVDGVMYITTPFRHVAALDPVSGHELWTFELPGRIQVSTRGLAYWPGDAKTGARVFFNATKGRLFALDARNGKPPAEFGKDGVLESAPGTSGGVVTSPPIIFKNLVITGAVNPDPATGRDGEVRAFDARTGQLRWTFHSIPRRGELYHETWGPSADAWEKREGAHVWTTMAVDAVRGIAYLPMNAPVWDRYGGDRKGNDLFSSSLVAVDANTGKYLWHFQLVHHDLWDYDVAAPPTLMEITKDGRRIPAVAVTTKTGLLFMLDRITGTPIYPVEERSVPESDVPGESASLTQPFPIKPAPLARQSMTIEELATLTPELKAYCEKLTRDNNIKFSGPFTPISHNRTTLQFPGTEGGPNWGGMSFDPALGYLFVNTNDLGQMQSLGETGAVTIHSGFGAVRPTGPASLSIPFHMVGLFGRFKDPASGMMCQQPPWGRLSAVNVNTGDIVWQIPLGVTDALPEAMRNTGRPSLGGSIVTAGGVLFIGATDDARFRAIDSRTGKELWTFRLKAAAHATPITYLGKDGKQYVAITSTGGGFLEAPLGDDSIRAFALP